MIKEFLLKAFEKWKNDYDFKTMTGAGFALLATVFFALYNGFLGIFYSSMWHGTICAYYLILLVLRSSIILTLRASSRHKNKELFLGWACVGEALMLFLLNAALFIPVTLMVRQQKPVEFTLIPAIAMAAYTTYKVTMASINLKRRRKTNNNLVKLLRGINFIDALVSIITLQNTLIMVGSGGRNYKMLPIAAVSSGIIVVVILGISVIILSKSIKTLKALKSAETLE